MTDRPPLKSQKDTYVSHQKEVRLQTQNRLGEELLLEHIRLCKPLLKRAKALIAWTNSQQRQPQQPTPLPPCSQMPQPQPQPHQQQPCSQMPQQQPQPQPQPQPTPQQTLQKPTPTPKVMKGKVMKPKAKARVVSAGVGKTCPVCGSNLSMWTDHFNTFCRSCAQKKRRWR